MRAIYLLLLIGLSGCSLAGALVPRDKTDSDQAARERFEAKRIADAKASSKRPDSDSPGTNSETNVPPVERQPKAGGQLPIAQAATRFIRQNLERGRFILLDDGSLWEVDSLSRLDALLWMRFDPIIPVDSPSGTLLLNTSDNRSVSARRLR